MPLTGDFAELERWARQTGKLANAAGLASVSRSMSADALELIEQGFERQRDPFGNPWAPRKQPKPRPIGVGTTGNLKRQRRIRVDASGFTIGSPPARMARRTVRRRSGRPRLRRLARNRREWRIAPAIRRSFIRRRDSANSVGL